MEPICSCLSKLPHKVALSLATPNLKADTIARLFVEHVAAQHGVPERLLLDEGPNFLSELMQEV